jgi:hypothetical protein
MAKFSSRSMGKENGPASVYAQPHNSKGQAVDGSIPRKEYMTKKVADQVSLEDPVPNGVSIGINDSIETTGIKIRGTGAATKGVMARGPMA